MSNYYPEVSIIVPAHNAEKTIEKCLRSLTELEYRGEYQVILVNNKSTDSTVDIARKYNVKIVDACSLQSPYYARNVGIAHSNSQIVAFTDSDCIIGKKWIHFLVETMIQNPQIGGVGGQILHKANNTMESIFAELGIGTHSFEGASPYLITANAAYRIEVLKETGLFDEGFFSGGDVDLSWRITKNGHKLCYEPRAIVYHFPRKSVYSFFRQHYIYGLGQARLCSKHKIKKDPVLQLIILFRDTLMMLGLSFPFKLVASLASKKINNTMDIMTPVFKAITSLAWTLGFIQGTKLLRSASRAR